MITKQKKYILVIMKFSRILIKMILTRKIIEKQEEKDDENIKT